MHIYRNKKDSLEEVDPKHLIEYTEYIVEIDAEQVFFLDTELEPHSQKDNHWSFKTPFVVGEATFTWIKDTVEKYTKCTIKPHPDKIEEREIWQKMLEDLLVWSESLLGHMGVRDASVEVGDVSHYLMMEALYPLLQKFSQSLKHLFEHLRERTITPDTQRNLLELRSPFPLQQIISNPNAVAWIRGKQNSNSGIPIVEAPFVTQTYNHPVNRYIRWLIERVIYRLNDAVKQLRKEAPETQEKKKERKWRDIRSKMLEKQSENLKQILYSSPIRDIPSSPLEDAAFLVILNDPLYATVHKYGRLLCNQKLSLDDGEFSTSMSRSFDIYELWCFQEVVRQFEKYFGIQAKYKRTKPDSDNPKWGTTAKLIVQDEEWNIEYNASFSMLFPNTGQKDKSLKRHSLLRTKRPDVVITYVNKTSKRSVWMALDAKYRTSQKNLTDAFSSAFAYRQSLIDPKFGGSPLGCYLLAPKILDNTHYWFGVDFAGQYKFGAFLYRPNATNQDEIVTFLIEQIQGKEA